ncbi:MAG TPA: EamA family transporter [Blastocatellia bacterium]|nr:EamA family transporter [Blastocatellia bacterium]
MMTALMIALVVLGGSIGDVLITKGMKQVGEIATLNGRELLRIAGRALTNKWFLFGLFFMTVSFFSFLAVLSWAALSLVLPATSVSFVITTIGAKLILKEKISSVRWAGIVLVCVGVALISLP